MAQQNVFLRQNYFKAHVQVWKAWMLVPQCPQLYLYSSSDALIPSQEVERFMSMQRQRGVELYSKMWEDSPHCEHFRLHPEEYTDQLLQFLKRIE